MPLIFLVALQILFIACAEILAAWIQMPLATLIGIGACGLAGILGAFAEATGGQALEKYAKVVIAASLILLPASLLVPRIQVKTLDNYYAIVAWLLAATIFAPSLCRSYNANISDSASTARPSFHRWRQLALVWAFIGGLTWLAASYYQNQFLAFHFGLGIGVGLLILARIWFRLNVNVVLLIHTVVLFLIGLPLVDLFVRPSNRLDARPETRKHYYSYNAAKRNPVAFANWWKYYMDQWGELMASISYRDPTLKFPFVLRPGTSGQFFQSHIVINSKGFRGKEFSPDKGRTFRIVAIGESTTFGVTMNADDKPWPELLEEMIRARLKPDRPVEVINAGVPAHTLQHTLLRLQSEILPLKPDMIICYHGYNGFPLLYETLPRVTGPRPPKYEPRPLKILADAEHKLKMTRYKNLLLAPTLRAPPKAIDPMASPYALAYRQLIQAARTNDIRLAIATFSMAANSSSDNSVMEFYRPGFPIVHFQVRANLLHAAMVRQLATENPDVVLVDTQPRLDGYHEKFIDLMHLTQEGRQEVAEAFFAGIKKTLQECLTPAAERGAAVIK
jgi:lysophospholipase L1-like esterase